MAYTRIVGRVTKDASLLHSRTDTAYVNFGIAEEGYETVFYDIVAFGKLAENSEVYLKKGNTVYCDADLKRVKKGERSELQLFARYIRCVHRKEKLNEDSAKYVEFLDSMLDAMYEKTE